MFGMFAGVMITLKHREARETLRSDDFRLNERNILSLIREYNLKHFKR
jgi:hypothetical protein